MFQWDTQCHNDVLEFALGTMMRSVSSTSLLKFIFISFKAYKNKNKNEVEHCDKADITLMEIQTCLVPTTEI